MPAHGASSTRVTEGHRVWRILTGAATRVVLVRSPMLSVECTACPAHLTSVTGVILLLRRGGLRRLYASTVTVRQLLWIVSVYQPFFAALLATVRPLRGATMTGSVMYAGKC
jgi:hypothetical protein